MDTYLEDALALEFGGPGSGPHPGSGSKDSSDSKHPEAGKFDKIGSKQHGRFGGHSTFYESPNGTQLTVHQGTHFEPNADFYERGKQAGDDSMRIHESEKGSYVSSTPYNGDVKGALQHLKDNYGIDHTPRPGTKMGQGLRTSKMEFYNEVKYLDTQGNETSPAKAFSVKVGNTYSTPQTFGGPGSGRHDEGGSQKTDDNKTSSVKDEHTEATKDTGWKQGNTDAIKGPTGQETRTSFTDKAGNNIRIVSGEMGHFAQVNGKLAGGGWTKSLNQAVKNAQNAL